MAVSSSESSRRGSPATCMPNGRKKRSDSQRNSPVKSIAVCEEVKWETKCPPPQFSRLPLGDALGDVQLLVSNLKESRRTNDQSPNDRISPFELLSRQTPGTQQPTRPFIMASQGTPTVAHSTHIGNPTNGYPNASPPTDARLMNLSTLLQSVVAGAQKRLSGSEELKLKQQTSTPFRKHNSFPAVSASSHKHVNGRFPKRVKLTSNSCADLPSIAASTPVKSHFADKEKSKYTFEDDDFDDGDPQLLMLMSQFDNRSMTLQSPTPASSNPNSQSIAVPNLQEVNNPSSASLVGGLTKSTSSFKEDDIGLDDDFDWMSPQLEMVMTQIEKCPLIKPIAQKSKYQNENERSMR